MATKIKEVETLKKYFAAVVRRAEHHAGNVSEIIYTLLGIIILKKDDGTFIEVRGNNEDATGNILWVQIDGTRYALRYEHNSGGSIEIRENSFKGRLIYTVDNTSTVSQLLRIF